MHRGKDQIHYQALDTCFYIASDNGKTTSFNLFLCNPTKLIWYMITFSNSLFARFCMEGKWIFSSTLENLIWIFLLRLKIKVRSFLRMITLLHFHTSTQIEILIGNTDRNLTCAFEMLFRWRGLLILIIYHLNIILFV